MWHLWAFLRIFCILNFDQHKGHQGFVSFIRVNGCMLPFSWCAKNDNLTSFEGITFFLFFLKTLYFLWIWFYWFWASLKAKNLHLMTFLSKRRKISTSGLTLYNTYCMQKSANFNKNYSYSVQHLFLKHCTIQNLAWSYMKMTQINTGLLEQLTL